MKRFKINKYLLLASMIFIALGLIAWTTNPGSILYTGEVVFQGPVTHTDSITTSGAVTNSSTVTNSGAVTNSSTVTNSGAVTNSSTTSTAGKATFLDDALVTNAFAFGTANYAFATTTANDTYDVADISMLFLDSSSFAGTIGGFANGAAGQQLFISVKDATETITIENEEGGTAQDILLDGAADVTLNVQEGIHLVCDGSNWYEIRR